MESIQNPQNFRKLATKITKKKPILALKSGESIAVDGRIKVRMKEAQETLKDCCTCGSCSL